MKKNSFLLVEILIALMLLGAALPLVIKNQFLFYKFSTKNSSENILCDQIDLFFLKAKRQLSSPAHFDSLKKNKITYLSSDITSHKSLLEVKVEVLEEKKGALLTSLEFCEQKSKKLILRKTLFVKRDDSKK